ncbi:hypothetical protein HW49_02295 [Porphyromonadaceae bacterium COT-184 OH4590]|nr:hypothetical protein HW49_02295 [Porphyromonadaceae bacterium COT-184 OH4590]
MNQPIATNKVKRGKTSIYVLLYFLLSSVIGLGSCESNKIKSMYFGTTDMEMSVGETDTIELFINPISSEGYSLVTWTSSDNSVAQVNQRGEVRAIYTGNCMITAYYRGIKATANIRVKPISIESYFSKAIAYFYGNYYNNGLNIFILRLLSDGYNIEPNGNIVGAGDYFNMELRIPIDETSLKTSEFTANTAAQAYTYLPGYTSEQDGNIYVSGTFMGFTSMRSSSAVLVKEGLFAVTKNSSDRYILKGIFKGNKEESISINYTGKILVFDKTQVPQDTLFFDKQISKVENIGDIYNCNQNIFRVQLADKQGYILQLEFVAPISAETLPLGTYKLDNSYGTFSLVPSHTNNGRGTIIIKNGISKAVLYGNVLVMANNGGDIKVRISLVSEENKLIN